MKLFGLIIGHWSLATGRCLRHRHWASGIGHWGAPKAQSLVVRAQSLDTSALCLFPRNPENVFPTGSDSQTSVPRPFSFSLLRFFSLFVAKTKRKRNEEERQRNMRLPVTPAKAGIQGSNDRKRLSRPMKPWTLDQVQGDDPEELLQSCKSVIPAQAGIQGSNRQKKLSRPMRPWTLDRVQGDGLLELLQDAPSLVIPAKAGIQGSNHQKRLSCLMKPWTLDQVQGDVLAGVLQAIPTPVTPAKAGVQDRIRRKRPSPTTKTEIPSPTIHIPKRHQNSLGNPNQTSVLHLFSFSLLRFFSLLVARTKRKRNEEGKKNDSDRRITTRVHNFRQKGTLRPFASVNPTVKQQNDGYVSTPLPRLETIYHRPSTTYSALSAQPSALPSSYSLLVTRYSFRSKGAKNA